MIAGKVCNTLIDRASSTCNICGCKPSQANNLCYVKQLPVKDEFFQFGFHPLQCRIRFLENLWHIACNLDFQCHKAIEINKEIKLAKKYLLQESFKSFLGLTIDVVKRGYGTTNDGNTARRFFESSDVVSKITGLDKTLITRFATILQILNCGYKVNIEKF